MAASSDEGLAGRILNGRYSIGNRIARGGMASVFLATDTRLDRTVAVKVMHSGLGDDEQFTDRFVREARTAAQLNHPNVVSVFDQGTDGDVVYLVMEYVPGETLRDVMRNESPMPPLRAIGLIEQILVALSVAHDANMIHRDIKPENVLITPDGDVKVTDFGLARAASAATTATGGTLIGTVSYLAPEIVVNEGADARADVYACGAILYEMLTGYKPHSGDSPIQIAYRHVHEDVPPPSERVEGIPPYLDALVQRSTTRNRDQRSRDAAVMLQQVRQVQRALNEGIDDDRELTGDLLPATIESPQEQTADDQPAFDDSEETSVVEADDSEGTIVVAAAGTTVGTQVIAAPAGRRFAGDLPPPDGSSRQVLQPPMPPEEHTSVREQRPRRRKGIIIAVLAALIVALFAGGGWYLGVGRYVEAPALVGLSLQEARAEAEAGGFEVGVIAEAFHDSEPPGTVLSADPSAAERILPGGTIDLTVSKGKQEYELPDVRGKTPDEAADILEEITASIVGEEERFSETYDQGRVIGVIGIKPGATVANGTEVKIAISKGRQPLDVESFVGKKRDEAERGLKEAGFEVDVEEQFSDDVDEGVVISQDPDQGTAFRNDEITIVVSKGPEFVDVPNVRAKRGGEAKKILEKAGFNVKFDGDQGNFVLNFSPRGEQRRGATITLTMFP